MAVVDNLLGNTVTGWASTVCIVCFMGGIQLMCLGVIGEYIGKIYMEVKNRPGLLSVRGLIRAMKMKISNKSAAYNPRLM